MHVDHVPDDMEHHTHQNRGKETVLAEERGLCHVQRVEIGGHQSQHTHQAERTPVEKAVLLRIDEGLQQAAKANTLDNFAYVFDKALEGFLIDRMEQNQDIFAKFMNDAEFKSTVAAYLRQQVYQQIRGGARA